VKNWIVLVPLLGFTLFGGRVDPFAMTPITLETARGILKVFNSDPRAIPFTIKACPPRRVEGVQTAALEPFSQQEQDSLVRIRPSGGRISRGMTRNINYSVLNPSRSFYLCAVTQSGTFVLRICSRGRGSPRHHNPARQGSDLSEPNATADDTFSLEYRLGGWVAL
jgi:hypothetical protein